MFIHAVSVNKMPSKLPEKLRAHIADYLAENYLPDCDAVTYGMAEEGKYLCRKETICQNSVPFEEITPCAPRTTKAIRLKELLEQADAGFTETLLNLIDKTGKKDSEIYKKANISKQLFSKIRNNPVYKPTKPTAIALAIALELNLEQTKDLIGRAGYALSNSSKFDLIICYFIEQGNYNLMEINMALYEFDQSLLGS